MNWTREQQRAIEERGNLLISAAAGSGKTAVLSERIARLIAAGAEPEEFLVVTFTRAAAAEMKKRIAARLYTLSGEAEGEEAARLSRCAGDIGRAAISTIDAFCAQVLRRHFELAGLDPAFRAAEETEAEVLRAEAMEELLEEKYANSAFCALVEAFGGEGEFLPAMEGLYDFLCAQPRPLEWLKGAVAGYDITAEELAASPMMEEVLDQARGAMAAAIEGLDYQRQAIGPDYPATAAILDDDLGQLRALLMQRTYPGYAAQLQGIEFRRFAMKGADDALKDRVKKARTRARELVKAQQRDFGPSLEGQAARIRALAPLMGELYAFMEGFFAAYGEKKRQAGVIDYGDMEHLALEVLGHEEAAGEYRRRFTYLFVDEYQDCNPVQDSIFERLRREDNLFLVGDVKQSIYRFRMAEPGLFTDKARRFSAGEGQCLPLSANFRSGAKVIDTVNTLFAQAMTEELGGVDYSAAALTPGRQGEPGGTELHLLPRMLPLDAEEAGPEEEGLEQLSAAETEALFAAERIRGLLEQEFTDKQGCRRKYRYSDIVILHGAPRRVAEAWLQTLSREGIPAYADMAGGYFEAIEVQVFLNLLRIIDNPVQDIPLLSVLRSPMASFTTEELILLRADFPGESCYASLLSAAGEYTPLGSRCAAFLARLAGWRRDAELYSLTELIAMLLEDTGYEVFVSALPGGNARRANLEALIQAASAYQRRGRGLNGFLRFMERVKDTGRMGAAQTASANVVRLISIHKSKGLEFPAVILAGLSRRFNDKERRACLTMDTRLGIGLKAVKGHARQANLMHTAISARGWRLSVSEQLRTLYVAMTRASERLIMLCSFQRPEEELMRRSLPLTPAASAQAMCYGDWVIPALWAEEATREIITLHRDITRLNQGGGLPPEGYLAFKEAALEAGPGGMERLNWAYPYPEDTTLPSKVSVSGLLGNLPEIAEYPAFLREKAPVTPAAMGSAAHALMQHVSLAPHTADTLRPELERLIGAGVISPGLAGAVELERIAAFFASELGRRLLASPRVERELAFNHLVRAGELPGMEGDEEVLLQGVIDCCFMEDGQWVLLDYKTDYVPAGRARQVAMRHRPQLELYRNALSALTGIPVREMYVHLLSIGESVKL